MVEEVGVGFWSRVGDGLAFGGQAPFVLRTFPPHSEGNPAARPPGIPCDLAALARVPVIGLFGLREGEVGQSDLRRLVTSVRRVGRSFLMVVQMRSFLTSSYRWAIMFRRDMMLWWFVIWLARSSS